MTGRLIEMTVLAALASSGAAFAEPMSLDLIEHSGVVEKWPCSSTYAGNSGSDLLTEIAARS
jgi:hypothetical protein